MIETRLKHAAELMYWKGCFEKEGQNFQNSWYNGLMRDILGEKDDAFFCGKTILDFGCGPRGSLSWAHMAARRIGADILTKAYLENFKNCMQSHNMEYISTTETSIPLPDCVADIVFTINSFDHVTNIDDMASELLRILSVGGIFAGSFNLFEEATATEPQCINYETIKRLFIDKLRNVQMKFAHKSTPTYANFYQGTCLSEAELDPAIPTILWLRGNKT